MIEGDPGALVATPKREVRMPAHLSEQEMLALLAAPAIDTPLARRDRAILELFYASGLRLSELAGLDLEDVNLSARMVRVLGKGGKERLVPFNSSAASAIRTYLKDRELLARGVSNDSVRGGTLIRPRRSRNPLFVNYRGTPLSTRSIDRLVHRYVMTLQRPARHQPACAPAFVRHAPAPARRRPPRHSGAPRPCAAEHDAALHARERRAVARRLPEIAPSREILVGCDIAVSRPFQGRVGRRKAALQR